MKNMLIIMLFLTVGLSLSAAEPAAKRRKGEEGLVIPVFGQAMPEVSKEEFIQAIYDGNEDIVDAYLTTHDDVDWPIEDEDDMTPLILAAQGQSLPIFSAILSKAKELERSDSDEGRTALLWAAGNYQDEALLFVQQLIAHGARVNATSFFGTNALMFAVSARNERLVNYFLNYMSIDAQSNEGRTALFRAVEAIARSAEQEELPVGLSVQEAKQSAYRIAELLLKRGAYIEHRDKGGFSPLLYAVDLLSVDAVTFLLVHGADINGQIGFIVSQPNVHRNTPLLEAIWSRSIDVSPQNDTAQAQAEAEQLTQEKRDKLMAIISILIDKGASLELVSLSPDFTISPLMQAAKSGDFEVVKLLVEHEADKKLRNNNETALTMAKGYLKYAQSLAKRSQYQTIIDYLSNPIPHHVMAQQEMERRLDMPSCIKEIVGEYLTGAAGKNKITNEIKTAIAKNDLKELINIFNTHPEAILLKNEDGNTPLLVAVILNKGVVIPLIIQKMKEYTKAQIKKLETHYNNVKKQESQAYEEIAQLTSEKEKEEMMQDVRALFAQQEKDKREAHEMENAFNNELNEAKMIAQQLGYQDIVNILNIYSPSMSQSTSATSSSTATAMSLD